MAKHHKPVEQSGKNRNLQKDVKEISEKKQQFFNCSKTNSHRVRRKTLREVKKQH